ncbi:uncharacterized protein FA14DRAFT_184213 [Meira miltonrushii]|uniref:Uncharacterized protein n=1 Tax=Meira miltonrushii TaxID=1280837 RepID=A0A316VBS2_9BASI|nr:uncharacterized protein FA14DRAFT_184213 [Meira miltonrushii]PWN34754.1 hypothetical protein FA14DRAFT_184213 [Meira miltonrushii]
MVSKINLFFLPLALSVFLAGTISSAQETTPGSSGDLGGLYQPPHPAKRMPEGAAFGNGGGIKSLRPTKGKREPYGNTNLPHRTPKNHTIKREPEAMNILPRRITIIRTGKRDDDDETLSGNVNPKKRSPQEGGDSGVNNKPAPPSGGVNPKKRSPQNGNGDEPNKGGGPPSKRSPQGDGSGSASGGIDH